MEQKSAMEQFIAEVEKLEEKSGGQGPFNLVGKTISAILKLAQAFLETESQQKKDEAIAFSKWKDERYLKYVGDGYYHKDDAHDCNRTYVTLDQIYLLFKENNP